MTILQSREHASRQFDATRNAWQARQLSRSATSPVLQQEGFASQWGWGSTDGDATLPQPQGST